MKEPEIIFQDDSIIVVNKPSGMVAHSDGKHPYAALDEWVKEKYGEIFLVHRLDRETSGVLLFARTEKAAESIKKQFQDRTTKKVYRAFVYGNLKDERGIIDRAIGSARGGTAPRSATRPYGRTREARTTYRRIENGPAAAYVEVFPQTGRTHQIRVHFAALQHPVVCDKQYAPSRPTLLGFKRLALHAFLLSLIHPKTGKEISFEAPLPADFVEAQKHIANA